MTKKIVLTILLLVFLFSTFLVRPHNVFAQSGGLVPCGRSKDDPSTLDIDESKPCTLCHLFVLAKRIIDQLSIFAAVLLAIMVLVGAIMFVTAAANPNQVALARKTLISAIVGFVIVLLSWVIVNTVVVFATGDPAGNVFGKPWHTIDCQ